MCLYPSLVRNPKYKPNKKNGGIIPAVNDTRALHVPIGCGNCMECLKQKANHWRVRLMEELKQPAVKEKAHFVTLTFNNEEYTKLAKQCPFDIDGYNLDNWVATKALRMFNERWRKKQKKALRHWFITELGHEGQENIHLHGIVWTNYPEHINKAWQYGYSWIGSYVNEQTVNYIVKYVTKTDQKHPNYKPVVRSSNKPGIGHGYTNSFNSKLNKFKEQDTNDTYITRDGYKQALPTYYRNKIYTDDERERLWMQKLDKAERYVLGLRIDVSKDEKLYFKVLKEAQKKNERLGYKTDKIDWEQVEYEHQLRELKQQERFDKAHEQEKRRRDKITRQAGDEYNSTSGEG